MSDGRGKGKAARVALTGATGFVGGRLLERLEAEGVAVRCLVRKPGALGGKRARSTEVVRADMLEPSSLRPALRGCETAYYLVHSMGAADFAAKDIEAALNFARAAKDEGVRRIVYLGGLGDAAHGLSPHLRSRQEVGTLLRSTGVPVVEFRASVVIGAGSLSFELIRALVDRLPVMVCPRWVATPTQPIAIDDLLDYLVQACDVKRKTSVVYEIGGPDQVTYGDLMREYARQRNLFRLLIPVPLLTPMLSSLWLGLVTPIYSRVGRKLIESLRNPTVVTNAAARKAFPIVPRGLKDAIACAVRESAGAVTFRA